MLVAVVGASLLRRSRRRASRAASRTSPSAVNTVPRLHGGQPVRLRRADSAPAVKIGTAVREEMKDVVGRDYQVIEQTQMNDALKQYGYPVDAILSPALATTLAKNIQARVRGQLAR